MHQALLLQRPSQTDVRNKPKGEQGGSVAPGHRPITHLEDFEVMIGWELLMKQKVGALRWLKF